MCPLWTHNKYFHATITLINERTIESKQRTAIMKTMPMCHVVCQGNNNLSNSNNTRKMITIRLYVCTESTHSLASNEKNANPPAQSMSLQCSQTTVWQMSQDDAISTNVPHGTNQKPMIFSKMHIHIPQLIWPSIALTHKMKIGQQYHDDETAASWL